MIKCLRERWFGISSATARIILTAGILLLAAVTAFSAVLTARKTVIIKDGDNSPQKVITFKRYVEDVLSKQGIALCEGDKISTELKSSVEDNMQIEIYRAFSVDVTEKGETKSYKVTKKTVGEALNELGLNVKESDKLTPGYNEAIAAGSSINLIRTAEETVEVSEEIPFESKEKINTALASGKRRTVQEGKVGEKKVTYKISYEDGVEVNRVALSETVISQPVNEIREIGPRNKLESYQIASAGSVQTSRSGSLSYSKVIMTHASAYSAASCGKSPSSPGYGRTATGRQAQRGVVAVDPSVIPLGTKLYIESADGSYVYGTAIAADTGSAIKGNRIDLCFNSNSEARSFGRRSMKVYILK